LTETPWCVHADPPRKSYRISKRTRSDEIIRWRVALVGLIIMIFLIFVSDGRLLLAQPFLIVRTLSCTSLFLVCLLIGTTLLSRLTCSDYADSIEH